MNYRDIESVQQLHQLFPNMITESVKPTAKQEPEKKPAKTNFMGDQPMPVTYAPMDEVSNIFKHIIIFTNNRDPKENKTLNNIYECVEELKKAKCEIIPEIHVFVAADVDSAEDESTITITDGDETFTIDEQSNTDTLVFSRLGVQDEYECEHVVKLLQDRGFLVLNPVQYSAIACDKYETAVLLQKAGIPQPNFTLMTKEIFYDEKLFKKNMKEVYADWSDKDDDNEKFEIVGKILDGHGGTGVFLENGKRIKAVMQAIFAIDPEHELILQKKEEADGGDIRVHVLTLRNKQVILAAMKRIKIKSDFRSNVSLGATAEPVKLTPEQEQIALKAAKVSKLPWVGVDIMPLVHGSNKELGDNAVLELNASPGTDGISEVIKHNFITILLNQLDDPSEFNLQDKIAGYIETVHIDWGKGEKPYLAKLDSGNGALASHIEVGDYSVEGDNITFNVDGSKFTFPIVSKSKPKTGDDNNVNERYVIEVPCLRLGLRRAAKLKMAVVRSRNKSTNVLLNRAAISQLAYVVNCNCTHMLTPEMEKIKIV